MGGYHEALLSRWRVKLEKRVTDLTILGVKIKILGGCSARILAGFRAL
jgi:hypothetical protein